MAERSVTYKERETTDLQITAASDTAQPELFQKPMSWIERVNGAPYFQTDIGAVWTPIGQNDAMTWPELRGAFMRKDLGAVDSYLGMLAQHGVTCLRLMLEYCHEEHRYLERPAGIFQPNMVRLWDDLFQRCEAHGLRILLTPYDTFWMWRRWKRHPYNQITEGACTKRTQWLLCPQMRQAIKGRLRFATERWGGSGALAAWDLWNEIHPAHAKNSCAPFYEFIEDVGSFLRKTEIELHGRAHLQTVSFFSPVLERDAALGTVAYNHPALDFATLHFYDRASIDRPKNTVDAAITTGRLVREALAQISDGRPFFDSEHGPIYTFNNRRRTLPEPFDDEYFRHMQWAHIASGGAGGGLRWPYRHPHTLTPGMRRAQQSLARFVALMDWAHFQRRNLNEEVVVSDCGVTPFACGDTSQAIVWLLRTDSVKRGLLKEARRANACFLSIPSLEEGQYKITFWDTANGSVVQTFSKPHTHGMLVLQLPPVKRDLAVAIRRVQI